MAELALEQERRIRFPLLPFLAIVGLLLFAANLHLSGALHALPVFGAAANELKSVQLLYGVLPRFIVAITAGGLLGLSTALMQQGLRNPLAEPGTIGLLSAGRLAVAVSLIWFPVLAASFVAPVLAGSAIALLLVLGLSLGRGFSPLFLILNGLVLGLCFDAITSILILTHFDDLADLLLWQAGSLVQDNWRIAIVLTLGLIALATIVALLRKPLSLFDLDDIAAGSLGLSPMAARLTAVMLSAVAAALVTAQLGILAFVGLAGVALANLGDARRFGERAARSACLAAAILLVTDQTMQLVEVFIAIPAGTVTALFAAPLLLMLLRTARTPVLSKRPAIMRIGVLRLPARIVLMISVLALGIAVLAALTVGRTSEGFMLATGGEWLDLLPWRWPRVAGALAAGGMVALAGFLMQRMTGNDLASPELIGVSSGAALVMLPVIFLLPPLSRFETMLAAGGGAFLFLILALRLARRFQYAPERLLLTGLAVTALSGALLSAVAYFGDIRLTRLVGWLSGSTYAVTGSDAVAALALLAVALAILPLLRRWLGLLPLGEPTSVALGIHVGLARLALIVLTALLTGVATVLIGPITFLGLVIPHLVRLVGIRRPLANAYGCVIGGALLMLASDWIGRMVAFPWDVPAGLVASIAGAAAYGITFVRDRR